MREWRVDIISMSFGFSTRNIPGYDDIEIAIKEAHSKDVLLLAAASNGGANHDRTWPARDDHVLCIHSTDSKGNRSKFSPTAVHDNVNFATVGEAIESAWPFQLCGPGEKFVKYKSGTSFATPIAAGIAIFLLQYARLYLGDTHLARLKRHSGMKSVLRKMASKAEASRNRDDYSYLALSLHPDNLFGKNEDFIKATIEESLS